MMGFWEKEARKLEIEVAHILGIDPSVGMVDVGKKKFPQFEFKIASATEMGLESDSADIISIAYGIRNVVEREKAFVEFFKTLKSGGLVVILEFTKDRKRGLVSRSRDFYMNKILPILGGMISGNREAYTYLPNSIGDFVSSEEMVAELESVGFETIHNLSFSMGVSSLIIARKGVSDV
jgi:demethylmenaquinone methyltransferase/2-methoxy-6-polyprenyl-1,4-benzoquinol methylase